MLPKQQDARQSCVSLGPAPRGPAGRLHTRDRDESETAASRAPAPALFSHRIMSAALAVACGIGLCCIVLPTPIVILALRHSRGAQPGAGSPSRVRTLTRSMTRSMTRSFKVAPEAPTGRKLSAIGRRSSEVLGAEHTVAARQLVEEQMRRQLASARRSSQKVRHAVLTATLQTGWALVCVAIFPLVCTSAQLWPAAAPHAVYAMPLLAPGLAVLLLCSAAPASASEAVVEVAE